MENSLSIIIPCYNEEKNIPLLIEKVKGIDSKNIEFIFVDNGSGDQTLELLTRMTSDNPRFHIVSVKKNIGYGNGIIQGLKASTGNVLGWIHADLQYEPSTIVDLMNYIPDNENWFIKGLRRKRSFVDSFFTFGMSLFESFIFRAFLWDINAQPTLLPRSLYNKWMNPPIDFSLDLYSYILAIKTRANIIKVPVILYERAEGNSSWNTGMLSRLRLIKRTIGYSFKLRNEI